MSDLNTAIQFIRQGNTAQAQKILEPIVRTETSNIPAWLWYAQTWPSQEMRLKVLVACLKFNPGNEQVLQALRLVRGKLSAQSNPSVEAPASPAVNQTSFARVAEEPVEIPPTFAHILSEQPQPDESRAALNWDELEQASALAAPVAPQAQPVESGSAFNWDELEQASAPVAPVFADQFFTESQPVPPEAKAPRHSYPFYKVWWTALTVQNVGAYADLLDDPEAGTGRAIEWQVYTNLVILSLSGMVGFFQIQTIFNMPEFQQLQGEFPMLSGATSPMMLLVFLLIAILVGVLFGVLGLLLNGAIQNFLAGLFGGTGNFSRTVYALSAYLIPISIIATVMGYIPLVNCLTLAVSGYSLVLNVRALQAAHGLNGGRATIIVAIPTLILLMFMCGGFVFLSSWIGDALPNYNYPSMP